MTDRFNTLTVVLEKEMRDDDAQSLIDAISHMRGVLTVSGNVASPTDFMAVERARHELGNKLLNIIYPKSSE